MIGREGSSPRIKNRLLIRRAGTKICIGPADKLRSLLWPDLKTTTLAFCINRIFSSQTKSPYLKYSAPHHSLSFPHRCLMPPWVSRVWQWPGSQTTWSDPGEGGPTWGEIEHWGWGGGGCVWPVMVRALRGPEVSRGVCEMTAALLGGPNPFH